MNYDQLTSGQINKIVLGTALSDGSISKAGRFDIYNKHEYFTEHIGTVFDNITGVEYTLYEKYDKKFDVYGYRLYTKSHEYFKKLYNRLYDDLGRKHLTPYIVNRVDILSLAYIWMCDGYNYTAKNRKGNTVQNIGYLCLEYFTRDELKIFINTINKKYDLEFRLEKYKDGFGWRPKISGQSYQKFVSLVYPYIVTPFQYKTLLFYKSLKYVDMSLMNIGQLVQIYETVEQVEDIVRSYKQL